jgi:hypothetical protein
MIIDIIEINEEQIVRNFAKSRALTINYNLNISLFEAITIFKWQALNLLNNNRNLWKGVTIGSPVA